VKPFSYARPETVLDAVQRLTDEGAAFLGGGTNLLDLMKHEIATPRQLVDVARLPLRFLEEREDGGLRIGALVTNAAVADDARVRERYPLLAQAILAGASPQLRNMATTGGNLLQRTRCVYFYDLATRCNKREPGAGCSAMDGYNRMHAVLGGSDHCIAVQPSDMCVALAALEARVNVLGREGERTVAFEDLHRVPGATPERDTSLAHGELVLSVDLPPRPLAEHFAYLKVRDRASYAFALVSVAAALEIEAGVVVDARVALGGVATKPWRDRGAEALLVGAAPTTESFQRVADEIFRPAVPREHNAFKIELGRRTVVRALQEAREGRKR
jgi:xanthine dehydrogenase YagS FAD-binding subunit